MSINQTKTQKIENQKQMNRLIQTIEYTKEYIITNKESLKSNL